LNTFLTTFSTIIESTKAKVIFVIYALKCIEKRRKKFDVGTLLINRICGAIIVPMSMHHCFQIQRYLLSVLPTGLTQDSMGSLHMGVAIYYGQTAYMVNNFLCNTVSCWQQTIARVRVNAFNHTSHNIST
jgi:hypothetical protein